MLCWKKQSRQSHKIGAVVRNRLNDKKYPPTRASAWELADTLALPVLLVVQPKGVSITLAAELQGLLQFRTPSHIEMCIRDRQWDALGRTGNWYRPMAVPATR